MKQLLLMIAAVMGQSVLAADKKPLITDSIVEFDIRISLKKPEGELTKDDLERMKRLSLNFSKISDESLKEGAKMQQLTYLGMVEAKITDVGLKEVAKLRKLEGLSLDYTQITNSGLKEGAKMKQLQMLWLTGTKITKADVAQLQKALPKCRIDHNAKK